MLREQLKAIQKELGENIKKLAFVNATKDIADTIEKLLIV